MRGRFRAQGSMFSYIVPERRIPQDHPLRPIRQLVRAVVNGLSRSLGRLYSSEGRHRRPPEQLLSALLVQVLYGIGSERHLMEQLDYNLLFRWFVGLSPDDPVWDPSVFTTNRERLQEGDVFQKFMRALLRQPRSRSARTRPMTPTITLRRCARSASRRTWRTTTLQLKTGKLARARSTPAPRAMPAMPSPRPAARWSNAFSAGASSTAPRARSNIAGSPASAPTSCSTASAVT
jgi:transposase